MYEDTIDYFPTPNDLAEQMAKSIAKKVHNINLAPGPILEPSAGTGNLVKAMDRVFSHGSDTKLDIDCIELSSSCRAILKKEGFRVVHDDFLTYKPHKRYKAIVMNPPFSDGIAHLKKAISIMQNGGAIRCILPAESIRHPHTREQIDLVNTLTDLKADIGYYKDAFVNSERSTKIEVALISIDIPEKPPESKIRLELQAANDGNIGNGAQENLVSNDPVSAAVERYNIAAEGLRRIYEEYEGIKEFLGSPKSGAEDPVISLGKSYNEAIGQLRMKYWQILFNIPAIRDNMTGTMQHEYSERLAQLADYDFSKYNILTIRQEIAANTVASIKREILKLFDWFTHFHSEEFSKNIHYFNGWMTNSAYKVNERIIFPCDAFCHWYNDNYEPTTSQVMDVITNIELVLHWLDTSGQPYDSSELWEIMGNSGKTKKTRNIACRYFSLSFYKKGTCHLTFTNLDVLKTFNAFACQEKTWLPPTYGKKAYADMSKEEKSVVRAFEGEGSYTDSLDRGLIVTPSKLAQLNA